MFADVGEDGGRNLRVFFTLHFQASLHKYLELCYTVFDLKQVQGVLRSRFVKGTEKHLDKADRPICY